MAEQEETGNRKLVHLLNERGAGKPYPCIEDLLSNGIVLERFADDESLPLRVDVTQFLAAWSRERGLDEGETLAWLGDYAVDKLLSLSRRSPNAVRHSTKGNVSSVFRTGTPFICDAEENKFRSRCCTDCPVYAEMGIKRRRRAEEARRPRQPPPMPQPIEASAKKDIFRKQFDEAVQLIHDEIIKKTKRAKIVELLNARGLKTRTGRQWSSAILSHELPKLRSLKALEKSPPPKVEPPNSIKV